MAPEKSQARFELSPTTRFADQASDYAAFRPSYPAAAIDAALEGLATEGEIVVADIGAGTGICSRLFADRGAIVLAVEPNEAMRASAGTHKGVTFVDGTAEATGLDAACVDLVVCAQAFHWFKPQPALAEFDRILKARGRLVFLVNERDALDVPMLDYNKAISAAAERELSEGMGSAIDEALLEARKSVSPLWFRNGQELSREGLVGRARSASYVPREGPRFEQLLLDLDALWARHKDASGLVTLTYRTYVWIVEKNPQL